MVALVRNDDARLLARRDVIDDLVGQIVHVDDSFARAGVLELVQNMIEQGAAGHLHEGFGHSVRQRPHAQAETGGEDHGFGGLDGHLFGKFPNRYSLCFLRAAGWCV